MGVGFAQGVNCARQIEIEAKMVSPAHLAMASILRSGLPITDRFFCHRFLHSTAANFCKGAAANTSVRLD
jgi:hypothetical protein